VRRGQPHVLFVVPAAAVDTATRRWRRPRRGKNGTYLFNEKAMAKVFRVKMLAAIEAADIVCRKFSTSPAV
jgi:hypothetical protein